jgi:hypothetical protein
MTAAAVTVRLSNPQGENASVIVVAARITNVGGIASKGVISGGAGISHKASQVNIPPMTKNAADPCKLRVWPNTV